MRDTLQAVITLNGNALDSNSCEVGFDGVPKPAAGQLYLAIHLAGWSPVPEDYDLAESFQVSVTATLRLGSTPQDRYGIGAWALGTSGLDAICRQVIRALHQNQAVRALANDGQSYSINTTATAGFYTTTQFVRAEPPKFRDYKWFTGGELTDDPVTAAQSGVSATLTFKADRSQSIPAMT